MENIIYSDELIGKQEFPRVESVRAGNQLITVIESLMVKDKFSAEIKITTGDLADLNYFMDKFVNTLTVVEGEHSAPKITPDS